MGPTQTPRSMSRAVMHRLQSPTSVSVHCRRSFEAMTVDVAALRAASTVAVEAYAAALRSPRRPPGRTLEEYHLAAMRATQVRSESVC